MEQPEDVRIGGEFGGREEPPLARRHARADDVPRRLHEGTRNGVPDDDVSVTDEVALLFRGEVALRFRGFRGFRGKARTRHFQMPIMRRW